MTKKRNKLLKVQIKTAQKGKEYATSEAEKQAKDLSLSDRKPRVLKGIQLVQHSQSYVSDNGIGSSTAHINEKATAAESTKKSGLDPNKGANE